MAPVYAVPRLLEQAGLTLQDFDFYEIHEAFASQVLATLAGVGDRRRASGARSTAPSSTSTAPRWRPGTRSPPPAGGSSPRSRSCSPRRAPAAALISICAAGGQGVVAVMEK